MTKKTYYTIYQIKNLINSKCYIGKHKTKDLDDGYFGSGTYLEIAFDDHGIENFQKEIICLCKDEISMKEMETYLIQENVRKGIKLYNLDCVYEYVGFGRKWAEEKKSNHSNKMKELWNDPEWVSKRKIGWIKPRSKVRQYQELKFMKSKEEIEKDRVEKISNTRKEVEFQKRMSLLTYRHLPDVLDHYKAFEELGFGKVFARTKESRSKFMVKAGYFLQDGKWCINLQTTINSNGVYF